MKKYEKTIIITLLLDMKPGSGYIYRKGLTH